MKYAEIRDDINISIRLGNLVIIFDYNSLDIMKILCEKLSTKNIFNVEIWQSMETESNSKLLKYVSKETIEKALNLYHMYNFSDKIIIISDSNQYGNLFNYVKNGILTEQEMVDALLYKI